MRTTLLVLVAGAAAADWWSRLPGGGAGRGRVEQIAKPLTTLLVIALAATADAPGGQVVAAVVALACCLAGDVALMPPLDRFVAGLAAFLCGHVAFIVLFTRIGLHHPGLAAAAAGGGLVIGATVGRRIVAAVRRDQPELTAPVVAYLLVIVSMATVGWATGRGWVLAGTAAFVVSDAVLGWEAFVARRRWLPLTVMITYHVAIVCLALSL